MAHAERWHPPSGTSLAPVVCTYEAYQRTRAWDSAGKAFRVLGYGPAADHIRLPGYGLYPKTGNRHRRPTVIVSDNREPSLGLAADHITRHIGGAWREAPTVPCTILRPDGLRTKLQASQIGAACINGEEGYVAIR